MFGHQFNVDVFNATFDNLKDNTTGKEIVEYKDHRELICTTAGFTEVDNSNPISDFGKSPDASSGIGYSDLKQAYSEGCNLVNQVLLELEVIIEILMI